MSGTPYWLIFCQNCSHLVLVRASARRLSMICAPSGVQRIPEQHSRCLNQCLAGGLSNTRSDRYAVFNIPGIAHLVQMIAEVGYAVLQVLLLIRFHFRGAGLLQFPHNPPRRMVLVLEIVTLFIKPLLTFLFMLVNCRSSTPQVLTGVVEIQNLLINVGTKKIPIGSCAIRNAREKRAWVQ